MKLASALEGGLSGAATSTILQEIFHHLNSTAKQPIKNEQKILKKIEHYSEKGGNKAKKFYLDLAKKMLTNTAYFGLAGIGKKNSAIWKGGLLGVAAGVMSVVAEMNKSGDKLNGSALNGQNALSKNHLMTVALYALGGLTAGLVIKKMSGNKKIRKWFKKAGRNLSLTK